MAADFFGSYGEDSERLRLSSQRFDPARFEWLSDYYYDESGSIMEGAGLDEYLSTYGGGDTEPRCPMEVDADGGDELSGDGPVQPPPAETESAEGFALREWRRHNAIRLEEKARKEKEVLKQIIEEADDYKAEYYKNWKLGCENSRSTNREKEMLFLDSRDKFHTEANKNYWTAISDLVPKEVPSIKKKRKKDKLKKPSVVVIQGPKPGKPTDLSRMHQILVKLKHSPPGHMLCHPKEPGKDANI